MKLIGLLVVLLGTIIGTEATGCSNLVNVAKGKDTSMSSIYSSSTPSSNCVDGNTDQHWTDYSCTSTNRDKDAWFKVDLGATHEVHSVIITNRQDCCASRIESAEVRVGTSDDISKNTKCGESVTSADIYKGSLEFECSNPVQGRYVSFQLNGRTDLLNFCELQVMARDADDTSCPKIVNVAKGKDTSMSSIYSSSTPSSNCVDGNTNHHWTDYSCTSTNGDKDAWFKVDLGGKYRVHSVIITNRQDCCQSRIVSAEVRVGTSDDISKNKKCGDSVTSADIYKGSLEFQCNNSVVGQYVSFQLVDRTDLLNFCELQVMADENQVTNLASNGKASQISTYEGGDASRLVDGVFDSDFNNLHCSHTDKHANPWWRMDLKTSFSIYHVIATNRQDCCGDRFDGAVIMIGNHETVSKNAQCGDQIDMTRKTYDVDIPFHCSLSGRYVGIMLKDRTNFLHVCGLQVYGIAL